MEQILETEGLCMSNRQVKSIVSTFMLCLVLPLVAMVTIFIAGGDSVICYVASGYEKSVGGSND